jgi:DNA-binding HxlR family transcriptional regulator
MDENLPKLCATYAQAFDIIGRRWAGAILRAIMAGQTRFSEIAGAVPGLSDRLLSERLKELERDGLVVRKVTPTTPVRIEYRTSAKGDALLPALLEIEKWASVWLKPGRPAATKRRLRLSR